MVFNKWTVGTKGSQSGPRKYPQRYYTTITSVRINPCFHVIQAKLALLSECHKGNWNLSDQVTFFQSSIVQFWWVCVNFPVLSFWCGLLLLYLVLQNDLLFIQRCSSAKRGLFLLPWSSLAIILWPLTSTRHFFPGLPDATIVCKWSVLCGKIPVISKLLTANYLSSPFLTLAGHWIAAMWLANYYAFVLTHSWTGVPEKMAGECIYHRNRNKSEKI